jgi:hypothetical protein
LFAFFDGVDLPLLHVTKEARAASLVIFDLFLSRLFIFEISQGAL